MAECRVKSSDLDAVDFGDVFGGPPRTVYRHKFAMDFTSYNSLYEDIFRMPEMTPPEKKTGRSLPSFSIPAKKKDNKDEFYSDIFGNDRFRKFRDWSKTNSKGKSKSSPVLSSENSDDIEMSSFASKLRPVNINITCKAACPYNSPSGSENQYVESFAYKSSYQGFSSQNVSSPDTTNLKPNSHQVTKLAASDFDLQYSSSSARSSLCQDWEDQGGFQSDGEEVTSPYVIGINPDHYREGNDDAINEAVAWAKERYQRHSPENDPPNMQDRPKEGARTELSSVPLAEDDELDKWTAEAKQQSQNDMELKKLEKEVELWSSGKKSNIRLLLSSLHQILWPNSSWDAILLTYLIDRSRVKKAYKKAQLCLHPDKLQQRGATSTQKYVAAKVFAILQDAWDAFVTQDVLLIGE